MLEMHGEVSQIFLNKVRVTTHPHNREMSSLSISNVLNDHILYLYLYFANQGPFVPPSRHNWEGITDFCITVNGQERGPAITNSQGYFHLRKPLHLSDDKELPLNYYDYAKEYAYIACEIPSTKDSNLKVLLSNSKTPLSVNITYTVLAN